MHFGCGSELELWSNRLLERERELVWLKPPIHSPNGNGLPVWVRGPAARKMANLCCKYLNERKKCRYCLLFFVVSLACCRCHFVLPGPSLTQQTIAIWLNANRNKTARRPKRRQIQQQMGEKEDKGNNNENGTKKKSSRENPRGQKKTNVNERK